MKLTLCTGKTNADATSQAFSEIKSLVLHGEKIFVVVPDRASLITELEVFENLKLSGVFNLQVVTINKLASMVIDDDKKTLSSFGGSLLVKKILKDNRQNLLCFNKISSNMNFASELYRTIQQFKSSGINVKELSDIKNLPGRVKLKLDDIGLVWNEYEKIIENNFSDGFSRLKLFKERIKTSDLIAEANFVFLYADNLTNEMLGIALEIIRHAKESFVALPSCSNNQKNENIYSNEALNFFVEFAKQHGANFKISNNEKTSAIKEKLFSFTLGEKKEVSQNILLLQHKNEIEEVQNCCNYILSQVLNGQNFDDFNIILADDKLEKPLERALINNQIPHFFDREIAVINHSLSKLIISLVNVFCFDFQSETVLELVKNYFFGSPAQKLADFENYVFRHGIEGGMFFSAFHDENAEEVRLKLKTVFDYYKTFKKEKNASGLIDLVKIILDELDVKNKLDVLSSDLEKFDDFENAKITLQIFDKIDEVLSDVELIFKGQEISIAEFREIILNGFSKKTISLVPVKTGSVYIGCFSSSYFKQNKTNIIIGASFGAFPANIKDVGIISDDEINMFKFKNKLEPSIKQLNQKSLFKAFELVADAKNVVLSFSKEVAGENKSESLASVDLKNIFDIQTQKYISDENILSNFNKALCENKQSKSEIGSANLQFTDNEIAITSLEKYFECPLKFALTTKVKIKERESGLVKAFDVGNIYHEFLFRFMKVCDRLDENKLHSVAKNIIDEVLADEKYLALTENVKNKLIIKNIKKESLRLANIAFLHNNAGEFKANKNMLEVSFGNGKKLKPVTITAGDKNYFLRGKIDRVDTFKNMARVIDYKTGCDKFCLDDIYYGKKIQLISYLSCLDENGFEGIGAYYFPLTNSYKGKNFIPKLDGITFKDQEVVRASDKNLEAGGKSQFLNIAIKKDGNFNDSVGKSTLLSQKEITDLKNYVKSISKVAIDEIGAGFCEPWPIKKDENSCACDYCPFKNSFYCLNAKSRKMLSVNKQSFAEKEEK